MAQVQWKIRQNATEMQETLKSLSSWEKDIKKKEKTMRREAKKRNTSAANGEKVKRVKGSVRGVRGRDIPAVRGSRGTTISVTSATQAKPAAAHPMLRGRLGSEKVAEMPSGSNSGKDLDGSDGKRKDAHTYDKGYKKWESFDVEAELAKLDREDDESANKHRPSPASVARAARKQNAPKPVARRKPAPVVPTVSREELDKQDGNKHYKRGEFPQAIKCYTRCIAANPKNAVAYSNRAQAHIKLKNYLKAEEDCTSAIAVAPTFVKSWTRRGTARNGLGRHRAALRDFEHALTLEPGNKKLHTEVRKTRENIKNCVRRTPRQALSVREVGGASSAAQLWGQNSESSREDATSAPALPSSSSSSSIPSSSSLTSSLPPQPSASTTTVDHKIKKAQIEEVKEEQNCEKLEGEEESSTPSEVPADGNSVNENETAAVTQAVGDAIPDSDDEASIEDEASLKAKAEAEAAAAAAVKALEKQKTEGRRKAAAAKRKKLWETIPTTSYEFLRVWKSFQPQSNDNQSESEQSALSSRAKYIQLIGAKGVGKLFKSAGLESSLFMELFHTGRKAFMPSKPGQMLSLLDTLAKCSRFSTTLMFLDSAEKAEVGGLVKGLLEHHGGKFPKRAGRIRKVFGSMLL